MPDRLQWCIENHAGAGVAHYFADAVAHFGFVAVGGALFAEGFIVAVFTRFKPLVGVGLQLAAAWAKVAAWAEVAMAAMAAMVVAPTVYFYHQRDGAFFPIYA